MFDAVRESELQVQRQHLMPGSIFGGIETLDLPSDVLQDQAHLEGGIECLEMRSDVCSDGERVVTLVDRIDGFERHTDFEHTS